MKQMSLSRRDFLRTSGLTVIGAILAACTPKTPTAEPTKPPEPAATTAAEAEPTAAPAEPTEAPQEEATVAPTTAPTPAPEGPIALTYAGWIGNIPPSNEGAYIPTQVEQAFNVDLTLWEFERSTANEQLATRIAGGETPDFIWNVGNVNALVEQGIAVEVPHEVCKQGAPGYCERVEDGYLLCWLDCLVRGKNYGFPSMNPRNMNTYTDMWRKDSLDKVGLAIPETVDEMGEAYARLVAEGVHDYGVMYVGTSAEQIGTSVFGAFGTFANMWMENEDKTAVTYGCVMDGARSALEVLQQWYADGLIDPEFLTANLSAVTGAWCEGRISMYTSRPFDIQKDRPNNQCIQALGGELVGAYAVKGPDGKFGYPSWGNSAGAFYFCSPILEGKKLDKTLEIFETVGTSQEWTFLVRFGKEGEHWERNEAGAIVVKEGVDLADLGQGILMRLPTTPENYEAYERRDLPEVAKFSIARNVDNFVLGLEAFMDPDVGKQTTEVNPTRDTWMLDFVTGVKPMSDWDQFIEDWNAKGGQLLTEEANRAYKSMTDEINKLKEALDAPDATLF